MKVCPKCNAQYEYEMGFCLTDGERLVFSGSTSEATQTLENKFPETEEETIVLPQQNSPLTNKMNFTPVDKTPQPLEKSKSASSGYTPKFENNISRPKLRADLVISVIGGILATLAIVIVGLNYLTPADKNGDNSNRSVSNQNSNPAPPVSTEVEPAMKEFNEAFYTGLKDKLRTASKNNGLKPLADTVLPKESIEIRLHLLPGFYAPVYKGFAVENSILILKRENMSWSGQVIRNVIKSSSDSSNAKEKLTVPLNQPQSGWDNLWQKLQANGVSAKPTKSETEVKTNLNLFIVESRDNGNYTYSYFHAPKENSPIEEEKRIASIFNLIAKEFDISDLKAS